MSRFNCKVKEFSFVVFVYKNPTRYELHYSFQGALISKKVSINELNFYLSNYYFDVTNVVRDSVYEFKERKDKYG